MSDKNNRPPTTNSSPWHMLRRWVDELELTMLVLLVLILGGIWLFAEIADTALEDDPHRLDTQILLALRSPTDASDPLGPEWLEEMIRDFTAFGGGGVLLFITFGLTGYLLLRRDYCRAWVVLATIMGGFLLTAFLKEGFGRPRPDLVPFETYVDSASFPSGHALAAATTYLTLGALLAQRQPGRRLKLYVIALAVILALLVGFSRIYLGVHWPTDVAGGWTIGAVWAILSLLFVRWWYRHQQPDRTTGE